MQTETQTYQLYILVDGAVRLQAGRLHQLLLQPGYYVYTGSARRNLFARVARHLSADKKMHWHIDYLLAHPRVQVVDVRFYRSPECRLNRATAGEYPAPGFGASDCANACTSHLCYQGRNIMYPGMV